MRDVNLRHARRIEALSHQANVDAQTRLAEEHRHELLTFSRMWEEKLAEYDRHANSVLGEVKLRHVQDYTQQEGMLKVQLMNKRPHFSRKVIDLRDQLEKAIALRNYLDAEEVKKKLAALEEYELALFDDSLATTFEKRTQVLKGAYGNELHAVEHKIKIGREELLTQRRIDFERLVARHANVLREVDQETKLHIAKTRQYVVRQVKAMVHDPVKTGMDLRGVAKTVRDGQGRSFRTSGVVAAGGGSRMRARTPPASASRPRDGGVGHGGHGGHGGAASYYGASTSPSSSAANMSGWEDTRFGW